LDVGLSLGYEISGRLRWVERSLYAIAYPSVVCV